MPAESDISEMCSPVSQSRRKSFGSSTFATLAKVAGSWAFTQASFGAVKPGKTMLPVSARKRGSASSAAASAKLRVSFHRMHGLQHRVGGIEQGGAVHLAGQPDAAQAARLSRGCGA